MKNLGLHSAKMAMGPVDPALPWDTRVSINIRIEPNGFFAAHYHQRHSANAMDDCEIYELTSTHPRAALIIFLRDPDRKNGWRYEMLNQDERYVFVPPGHYHGGLVTGPVPVTFTAYTRVSHTKPGEPGSNVIWLEDGDQPKELFDCLRSLRKK